MSKLISNFCNSKVSTLKEKSAQHRFYFKIMQVSTICNQIIELYSDKELIKRYYTLKRNDKTKNSLLKCLFTNSLKS